MKINWRSFGAAAVAFAIGVLMMPLLPFGLAVIVYNETDGWEDA